MTVEPTREEVAAAEAYEALHVPALFRQWAPRVCEAAQISTGERILDIACGTGILAREASGRAGQSGSVVGLDPSPGMLAVARRSAPSIEWRQGTAEDLPFEDGSFNVVVSQFGLMFFTDRDAAVREMLRVLGHDGRFAVAVWDSLDNSEAYPIEVDLLERLAGSEAADALRAPFVMGDTEELRSLFEGAGATGVEIATHHGKARFPSVRRMVEADLRGWLPVMGVHLEEEAIAEILEAADDALDRYITDDGAVEFDSPAHIVTGSVG